MLIINIFKSQYGTGIKTNILTNGIEQSRNEPLQIWSGDFNKDAKTIQWGKDSLFNHGARKTGYLPAKE